MNIVLPSEFTGNSRGETFVWKQFKELLGDGFISFHNRYIGMKEADVILMCPNRGILVIEIKGILATDILEVKDISYILMRDGEPILSPLKQADTYRYSIINKLKQKRIRSVYVMSTVCFPFITRTEFEEKGLGDLVDPIRTFTSEDLDSREALQQKIDCIFDWVYKEIRSKELKKYRFNGKMYSRVAKIFYSGIEIPPEMLTNIEPQRYLEQSNKLKNKQGEEFKKEHIAKQEGIRCIEKESMEYPDIHLYSRMIYVKCEKDFEEKYYNEIIQSWLRGVKIYFYTGEKSLYNKIKILLEEKCEQINSKHLKVFKVGQNGTFLFNMDYVELQQDSFEIQNGESYDKYTQALEHLDKSSSFNWGQYQVEHANLQSIIVKAGAGTGKTFSMISRINYLIWKCGYTPEDLTKAIMMITFTNESTNAMKEKIQENFMNLYRLTKDVRYLSYIDGIENIQICTIHSMAKMIIQKYGSLLGLGKDFSISSGEYQRRQFLNKHLNLYIEEHKEVISKSDLSMFYLQQRLIKLLGKLDNKNIDLVSDEALDFGQCDIPYFDDLITVMKDVQAETRQYCNENNTVALGDLIRRLNEIYDMLHEEVGRIRQNIDFLFVDEFQDTDDVQIGLMKNFQELFGFKFLVVGDIKQCIYRFRGAETKSFDVLNPKEHQFLVLSLSKNYRTDPVLMQALNSNFMRWHENKQIDYVGKDVLTAALPSLEIDNVAKGIDKLSVTEAKFEETLVNQMKIVKKELEKVNENKQSGRAKAAILVRENWQIQLIIDICKRNKIQVETDIGGTLYRIDPTLDLFKLIQALIHSESPGYLYGLYATAYVKQPLKKVELLGEFPEDLVQQFKKNPPLKNWNKYLEALKTEPVLKVLKTIIDETLPSINFARSITDDIRQEENYSQYYQRNLNQVFEKLIVKSNTDYLTLNKVASYLEIMILTRQEEEARESFVTNDESIDFVCTTVHKSKGLEYDTVILPYIDFDISCKKTKGDVDLIYLDHKVGYRIKGDKQNEVIENDFYKSFAEREAQDRKEEEARILYVALTRAMRRIICIHVDSAMNNKLPYTWNRMIGVN